jgi:hypothetical protein
VLRPRHRRDREQTARSDESAKVNLNVLAKPRDRRIAAVRRKIGLTNRLTSHNRDSEIGYVNVPGAPSQPASNDDTSVPAIVVASHE